MYYVYELAFKDGSKYIGCTNNISRRRSQHNSNARKRSSKLGVFLSDSGVTLDDSDFVVLATYDDRASAFCREREIAKTNASAGVYLLNDNYSNECSRAGIRTHDTSKAYVVVDFIEHTATFVVGLKPYCDKHGLDYKLLQRTAKGNHVCSKKYKAFHLEDWEAIEDKNYYLSGKVLQDNAENWMRKHVEAASKSYEVKFPDGHTEIVTNLDRFARDHNLTSGTLHSTFNKNKPTKGFQVVRRI